MGNIVTLRNGQTALEPMVSVTFLSLKTLLENDPISFFELVEICRDPSHEMFGNTAETLSSLALISNGKPNSIVKTVLLAATEGEGFKLRLVSPYADQPRPVRATERKCDNNILELFRLAHKIADIVFEYCVDYYADGVKNAIPDSEWKLPWMQDWRKQVVNPYYNQTNGFFLELYYGMPNTLWTPWGKWKFGGSGSGSWSEKDELGKSLLDKVLERTGAVLHIEEQNTSMGVYGPVYALHCVDDMMLPTPEELDRSVFIDYEIAEDVWEGFSKKL